jgi:hypothetical protein
MKRQWWCAIIMRLYPASFRRKYGPEMIDTILALRGASSGSRFHFWLFICADACRAGLEQRVDAWRGRSRVALNWIAACTLGAAAWKALGTTFAWLFAYFYHPYLEGTALSPWIYGATLGAGLGVSQCLVVRQLPRTIWIVVTAALAAVGLEVAVRIASTTGPIGFGAVVGVAVASGQWVVLRERFHRATWLAAVGGLALSMAAISLGVAINRAPFAMNALNHYVTPVDRAPMLPLHALYAPMDWTEWSLGLMAIATSGLVVGAITARPVSSMLTDVR